MVQNQPWLKLPWVAFNWRYDSGLVASNPALDNFSDASSFLTPDSRRDWLFCVDAGGVMHSASLTNPLAPRSGTICGANPVIRGKNCSTLQDLHLMGHNPSRVKARNLFDRPWATDNLFQGSIQWSLRFTVII